MLKSDEVNFRRAAESDIPFLTQLRRITMRPVVINHLPWNEEEQHQRILLHFDSARILILNQQDAGLLKVVYSSDEILLSQIQILPEFHGRGIGSKIIQTLQTESRASKRPIKLHVYRSNPAVALYTRLGFQIAESSDHAHWMRWK